MQAGAFAVNRLRSDVVIGPDVVENKSNGTQGDNGQLAASTTKEAESMFRVQERATDQLWAGRHHASKVGSFSQRHQSVKTSSAGVPFRC